MPKRSSRKGGKAEQLPSPQPAQEPALTPTESELGGKDPAAVELGRRGGKKGGPARAAKLTEEQRREIARKAARARWQKR
jgi:hypothetical protein